MNEGFSDMGCVCGIFCGSKINMVNRRRHRKKGKTALRSMSNPKLEGQPDTYGGTNWKSHIATQLTNDYCGCSYQ
jgi:Zn-dependent metalloprotease